MENISRFRDLDYKKNFNFYARIFTPKEIDYCINTEDVYQHFAVRYCAKEAFIKAVGEKIIDIKSVEICMEQEKPVIHWGNKKVLLSLSHCQNMAIAFVTVTL